MLFITFYQSNKLLYKFHFCLLVCEIVFFFFFSRRAVFTFSRPPLAVTVPSSFVFLILLFVFLLSVPSSSSSSLSLLAAIFPRPGFIGARGIDTTSQARFKDRSALTLVLKKHLVLAEPPCLIHEITRCVLHADLLTPYRHIHPALSYNQMDHADLGAEHLAWW